MTLTQLNEILRRAETITFAKRLRRAPEAEIKAEILAGINEHIAEALSRFQEGAKAWEKRHGGGK